MKRVKGKYTGSQKELKINLLKSNSFNLKAENE